MAPSLPMCIFTMQRLWIMDFTLGAFPPKISKIPAVTFFSLTFPPKLFTNLEVISHWEWCLARFRTRWPTSLSPTGAERQSLSLRRRCPDSCQSLSSHPISDMISHLSYLISPYCPWFHLFSLVLTQTHHYFTLITPWSDPDLTST